MAPVPEGHVAKCFPALSLLRRCAASLLAFLRGLNRLYRRLTRTALFHIFKTGEPVFGQVAIMFGAIQVGLVGAVAIQVQLHP